nr:MAG TPA: hypothetical protein [Caudoviricetes sp.]
MFRLQRAIESYLLSIWLNRISKEESGRAYSSPAIFNYEYDKERYCL